MNEKTLSKAAQELGSRGGKANKGTQKAKVRASKAARARWAMHTPSHVREMFRDAIEAFMEWNDGEPEPTVEYDDKQIPISKACGLLWNCQDILPRGDYDWLQGSLAQPKNQTYAAAAHAMLPEIKKAR